MIESPKVDAIIPDRTSSDGSVGGPIAPNFTGTFVRTRFDAPQRRALRMPDRTLAPAGAAGALIQVTTHSRGQAVTVWVDGSDAPLLKVPAGGVTSTSTVVPWDRPFSVRTSAQADVYVVVHGWIVDDPHAGVAAGGVGLAGERVVRLDTGATHDARWLMRDAGRPVQLTGLGRVPTKTSGVVVEAYLQPSSDAVVSLQMGSGGMWRDVTTLASRAPVTQLLVLPVSADGTASLRSTRPLNVRLTPLAWLSAGEAWEAPERAGGFVPVLPDAVNDGHLGEGGTFEVPGIPDTDNVIAAVSGQAFGNGTLEIATRSSDPHTITLPVRGPSTGLVLIPDAQDGARISLSGSLEATVNVVGYVRVAQPAIRSPREASDIRLTPDLPEGAQVDLGKTGLLTVRGQVGSDRGIQDVAITLPGYPTFHAEINQITGAFTADLRPPAGTHSFTFTATDSEGGTTSVARTVSVTRANPYDEILARGTVSLSAKSMARITRVTASRIFSTGPLLDAQGQAISAGAVVLSRPFAASKDGLSRVVTAVASGKGGIVYYTRSPQMNEIFEQAALGVDDPRAKPRYDYFNDEIYKSYTFPYEFTKDWGSGALTGSIWLKAAALGEVRIKLVIGSTWFFPQLDFLDVEGNNVFKADAGAKVNLDYKDDLYADTPFKVVGMAGPVPIVIAVPLRVYLNLQGSVEVTAYGEVSVTWRVLYTREEMFGGTGWRDLEWKINPPKWRITGKYSADMKLGVEIRPRVTLAEALGLAGPIDVTLLGLTGAGQLEANSDGKQEYTCTKPLRLYSDVSMGLDFILLADKYQWAIVNKSSVLDIEWWKQSGCGD